MTVKAKIRYSFPDDILVFRPMKREYESSIQMGDIIFDLDKNRKIVGVELMGASRLFGISKSVLNNIVSGKVQLSVSENLIKIHIKLNANIRNTDKTAAFALRDIKPKFINPTELNLAIA